MVVRDRLASSLCPDGGTRVKKKKVFFREEGMRNTKLFQW